MSLHQGSWCLLMVNWVTPPCLPALLQVSLKQHQLQGLFSFREEPKEVLPQESGGMHGHFPRMGNGPAVCGSYSFSAASNWHLTACPFPFPLSAPWLDSLPVKLFSHVCTSLASGLFFYKRKFLLVEWTSVHSLSYITLTSIFVISWNHSVTFTSFWNIGLTYYRCSWLRLLCCLHTVYSAINQIYYNHCKFTQYQNTNDTSTVLFFTNML